MKYSEGSSFIGNPWSSRIADWPGVSHVAGSSNYYPLNTLKNDVQLKMRGGKTKRRRRKRRRQSKRRYMRGGSILPNDITNLGRSIGYSAQSLYNNAMGNSSVGLNANQFMKSPNPLPEFQGKYTYPKL